MYTYTTLYYHTYQGEKGERVMAHREILEHDERRVSQPLVSASGRNKWLRNTPFIMFQNFAMRH